MIGHTCSIAALKTSRMKCLEQYLEVWLIIEIDEIEKIITLILNLSVKAILFLENTWLQFDWNSNKCQNLCVLSFLYLHNFVFVCCSKLYKYLKLIFLVFRMQYSFI